MKNQQKNQVREFVMTQQQTTIVESAVLPVLGKLGNPVIIRPNNPWPEGVIDYRRDCERTSSHLIGWIKGYLTCPAGLFPFWEVFWLAKQGKRIFFSKMKSRPPERYSDELLARLTADYEPGDRVGRARVIERFKDPKNEIAVIISPDLLEPRKAQNHKNETAAKKPEDEKLIQVHRKDGITWIQVGKIIRVSNWFKQEAEIIPFPIKAAHYG